MFQVRTKTDRKRDSIETRLSIREFRIKMKPDQSPEVISIPKYPYDQNAEHHQIGTQRQHYNFNIISPRTTTRT